jgi:hypothetical protein
VQLIDNRAGKSFFADCCNVHAVYNAKHGKGPDFKECYLWLLFIAIDPVHQHHKIWNSFFEKGSANAKFLMICREPGSALHVRKALLDYPPDLKETQFSSRDFSCGL